MFRPKILSYFLLFTVSALNSSFAMNDDELQGYTPQLTTLTSFADLKVQDGSVLLLDIDNTLAHNDRKVNSRFTSTPPKFLEINAGFLKEIQEVHGDDIYSKFATAGTGMSETTEEGLPEILGKFSIQQPSLSCAEAHNVE